MSKQMFGDLTVNGVTIPQAAVAAEAQNHIGEPGRPGIAWCKAARALAVRELVLQEARQRGLSPQPEMLGAAKRETADEALIREVLDRVIDTDRPTLEDVQREWSKDPGRFCTPPIWDVSHILCACSPGDREADAAAHRLAENIIADLTDNPAQFAALANQHSACASKDAGGLLPQLRPQDVEPGFADAVRRLSVGEMTLTPIRTRYGWHVIRLDAAAASRVLPFETVKDKIADAMEKADWSRKARSFLDALVADATIEGITLAPPGQQGSAK